MCQVLSKAWRPGRGVEINELEGRLFLFRCNHIIDVRRIIDDGTWSFDGHLLLTHELQEGETPTQVAFNKVVFWIQIHKLPHRYFSEEAGRAIGNGIGSFLDYDERNANFLPDAYMRVCIALDVRAPLLQETQVLIHNNSEITCPLKYERLPLFCYICGILGHVEKHCELRFRFPAELLIPRWDESIRVVPRHVAKAREANPWLIVRNNIDPAAQVRGGRFRGRHNFMRHELPANVQQLSVCMGANVWDKDKPLNYPERARTAADPIVLDEKKRRRRDTELADLMDTEDNPGRTTTAPKKPGQSPAQNFGGGSAP
ncbi:hypothetical protein LINGRAHAP2_LOCUS9941 [Linum grandiflorum]